MAAQAGLRWLAELVVRDGADPEAVRLLRKQHGTRFRRWTAQDKIGQGTGDNARRAHDGGVAQETEQAAESERRLRIGMIEAERGALVAQRDRSSISDDVLRRVQRDLDLETMLLDACADDAPDSPYEDV